MKKTLLFSLMLALVAFVSCTKTETVTVDSSKPNGTFTPKLSGALVA